MRSTSSASRSGSSTCRPVRVPWMSGTARLCKRAFHQALAYGIEVGVTAEQVADAAFYGRRVALAGNTPVCLGGRSFHKFASDVEACFQRGES